MDRVAGMECYFPDGADTLFVGLSSLSPAQRIPGFEWRRLFSHYPVARLHLRDFPQVMYQRGVPGISSDIDGTARWIQNQIEEHDIQRVAFFGACAGGYAAIVLGHLLGADEVYAFSPVTLLPTRSMREVVTFMRSERSRAISILNLRLKCDPRIDHRYYDLARTLDDADGRTRFHLHYGVDNRRDRDWCFHLAHVPGVNLHGHPSETHPVSHDLKAWGQLALIVDNAYWSVTQRHPQPVG